MQRFSTGSLWSLPLMVVVGLNMWPSCSSGFSSCIEDRVCPVDGDGGAGGNGGAAGDIADTLGTSGDSGVGGAASQSTDSGAIDEQCSSDADCGSLTPHCENRKCVSCSLDDNLGCSDDAPICSDDGGSGVARCVECESDDDCNESACLAGECVVGCQQNDDCDGTRSLCGDADLCVQCRSDDDCATATPLCNEAGLCAECLVPSDCPGSAPACVLNECTCPLSSLELASDPDNCGACGNVCPDNEGQAGCDAGQCVVLMVCGNGIPEAGEDCDDGNANNFDQCTTDCTSPECGNGVREGDEGCDDGNDENGDECTNDCEVPGCGDGNVEGAEACDPPDGVTCNTACQRIECGDGVVEGVEACDPPDADSCSSECQVIECGDGVTNGEEECDPPDGVNCDENCAVIECAGSGRECATLGRLCQNPGTLGCNGTAQKLRLICQGGVWSNNGSCESDENCDQTTGVCSPVIAECAGQDGGFLYCDGLDLTECGEDLVTSSVVEECTAYCTSDYGDASCVEVEQVVAGRAHTCVLSSFGTVRCWGLGSLGQLGYGSTANVGAEDTPSEWGDVDVGGKVTELSASPLRTCALLDSGDVRCWGQDPNMFGSINNIGDDEPASAAEFVNVGTNVASVSAGTVHACVLTDSNGVRCWGQPGWGSLGYAVSQSINPGDVATFGDVDVGGTVRQVVVGEEFTCALLTGGTVRCWGRSGRGRLGYGDGLGDNYSVGTAETPAEFDRDVEVGWEVQQLAAGSFHVCALTTVNQVRCWGRGDFGQLGNGATSDVGDDEIPSLASWAFTSNDVVYLDAGLYHTCAVLDDGGVRCWGAGGSGRLGYGSTDDLGDVPSEVAQLLPNVIVGGPVREVACGDDHTCALMESGAVRCWGENANGQLGYGHTNDIGDNESPAQAGNVPVY